MIVTPQTQRARTLGRVPCVVADEKPVDFEALERASAYDFIRCTIDFTMVHSGRDRRQKGENASIPECAVDGGVEWPT